MSEFWAETSFGIIWHLIRGFWPEQTTDSLIYSFWSLSIAIIYPTYFVVYKMGTAHTFHT